MCVFNIKVMIPAIRVPEGSIARTFLYSSVFSNCQLFKNHEVWLCYADVFLEGRTKAVKRKPQSGGPFPCPNSNLISPEHNSSAPAVWANVCSQCATVRICLRRLPWVEVFFPSLSSVLTALRSERRRWKLSVVKSFLLSRLTAGRPADRCSFISILRPWEAAACSSFFSQIGLGLESVVLFLLSRQPESTASCLWEEELLFTLFVLLPMQNS